jgi:hypothetical protein
MYKYDNMNVNELIVCQRSINMNVNELIVCQRQRSIIVRKKETNTTITLMKRTKL